MTIEATARRILLNACEAANDKRADVPQPYWRIVIEVSNSGAAQSEALFQIGRNLEVIARLLEAATLGAGDGE